MKIQVTIREAAERDQSGALINEGTVVMTYTLPAKMYSHLPALFEEARQVWDEHDVEFTGIGFDYKLVTQHTYKQELMNRQWLLDLHDECASED